MDRLKVWLASAFSVILILSSFSMIADVHAQGKTDGQAVSDKETKRYLSQSDEIISQATASGCELVKKYKVISSLTCHEEIALRLGLSEDLRVFTTDTAVNAQIGADKIQSSGNTGSGRKIVVLDTGYDYTNPELSSSYIGGKDFVNDDRDPMDDNGHGTHVAGIITADGIDPEARGVAPDAKIIAGKVLAGDGGGYLSDAIAAIYWAVDGPDGIANTTDDFKPDAISMSFGTSSPSTYSDYCDTQFPEMTEAVKYARDRKVTVVVAAGNEGTSGVAIPGCISYSTTIGAVDHDDVIAPFSAVGKSVDFVAPGVGVFSTWLGGQYFQLTGTSQGTPVVSGTVALIKREHPGYSVTQVENALKKAEDLGAPGKDNIYGWGRVDAYEAIFSFFPVMHMLDTTASGGKPLHSSFSIRAEYATSTSQLIGDKIDQITIRLAKVNSPKGNATVGIFDSSGNIKKQFGTTDVSKIGTSYADYTFTLSNNELYLIQSGDSIGIKYTDGSSNKYVNVMTDTNAADPFDGTNTYRQTYTRTGWQLFPSEDMYMILKQTHA